MKHASFTKIHCPFLRSTAKRRGAAAVEFALIAPLFLLLLAGILEFGQAFRVQHALSSAVRKGARAAVIDGSSSSTITTNVKQSCNKALGVAVNDVTVSISVNGTANAEVASADEGDEIKVTTSIPYAKVGVGFFSNRFASSALTATCILEHE